MTLGVVLVWFSKLDFFNVLMKKWELLLVRFVVFAKGLTVIVRKTKNANLSLF